MIAPATGSTAPQGYADPERDCPLCPRLAAFRAANRAALPGRWHAPVPAFGALDARLLVVGLAPGLHGANSTGRPFTGDYAGDTLYAALTRHGFAVGAYGRTRDDGLRLVDCRVTNAVRCVPPENKPTPEEATACRPFLIAELAAARQVRAILALGKVAHDQTLRTLGLKLSAHPFGHGARHDVGAGRTLYDSYHCSRYNTNTGRLTEAMFDAVIASIRADLGAAGA